jgi:hypothetical protein
MMRALADANAAWLIRSNIARFQHILSGELTALQRQSVEQLLAGQRAKLEELDRSEPGA